MNGGFILIGKFYKFVILFVRILLLCNKQLINLSSNEMKSSRG